MLEQKIKELEITNNKIENIQAREQNKNGKTAIRKVPKKKKRKRDMTEEEKK